MVVGWTLYRWSALLLFCTRSHEPHLCHIPPLKCSELGLFSSQPLLLRDQIQEAIALQGRLENKPGSPTSGALPPT